MRTQTCSRGVRQAVRFQKFTKTYITEFLVDRFGFLPSQLEFHAQVVERNIVREPKTSNKQ